ncbi:MAG TPA: ATP-binding protein [Longimicrobium sp.]|nr:ATP-binding protein [Longimicrobium sp.]
MQVEKPADVFDRDAEWQTLGTLWAKPRPDLVFVVGRRRVGKSFMLSRFVRAVRGIYYQATRRTESEQLASLSRIIGLHFDDPALQQGVAFPSWEDLFAYVTRRAGDTPFLFVLDEFPYLAAAAPALPSIIQSLWDHDWSGTRMKLVLSGSYITAMNRLEQVDQPLYGRRTGKLVFNPFSFPCAARFAPGYNVRDQLVAYGIFGHLPGHLTLLEPERPLGENVAEALLSPTGRLVDEAQHMLDAFTGDAHVHYSIIEAIASGEQTWSGITKRVGRGGGALLRPLQWLEEMQVIGRIVPVTEKNPQKSKRVQYRLVDPYVAFWHRIVARLVNAGSLGLVPPDELWETVVVPELDDYMGPVFEEVCRAFVRHSGRLPFRPLRVGEWWDATSQNQVDVVMVGARGDLLAGECKWGRVTMGHLTALRSRAQTIAAELGNVQHIHEALFSGRGEADEGVLKEARAGRVLLFTAEDLVGPA